MQRFLTYNTSKVTPILVMWWYKKRIKILFVILKPFTIKFLVPFWHPKKPHISYAPRKKVKNHCTGVFNCLLNQSSIENRVEKKRTSSNTDACPWNNNPIDAAFFKKTFSKPGVSNSNWLGGRMRLKERSSGPHWK